MEEGGVGRGFRDKVDGREGEGRVGNPVGEEKGEGREKGRNSLGKEKRRTILQGEIKNL